MTHWLISDHHFGHANILTFRDSHTGSLIRPGFDSVEEMDEYMIERWNSVVKAGDRVYHLGDFAFTQKSLAVMKKLNGTKRLVLGNHDKLKPRQYINAGFQYLYGMKFLDSMVLTHAPTHPNIFNSRTVGNVHGHIHQNRSPKGPYLNVCVEALAYTPISVEEAKARLLRFSSDD